MAYNDLVFNPEAYARVIAKQDASRSTGKRATWGYTDGKATDNKNFGCYYDPGKGYGKIWDSVNDWHKSREWN